MLKRIIKVGTLTNTAGETANFPSGEAQYANGYALMDLLVDVTTLTGTSPTITVKVEEQFSGAFFQTGATAALSATGKTTLANKDNPLMGKGQAKRIVTTPGGTVTGLSVDIYAVYFRSS